MDRDSKEKYEQKQKQWSQRAADLSKQFSGIKLQRDGNFGNSEYDHFENTVIEAISRYPEHIQKKIKEMEVHIGAGENSFDKYNKQLNFGKDVDQYKVDHELGHFLEEYFIDKEKLQKIKTLIVAGKDFSDIEVSLGEYSDGRKVTLLYLAHEDLYTTYQGRLYSETLENVFDIFDEHGIIKADLLWELISETLPHYMLQEQAPNKTIEAIYELIEEAMK